MGRRERGRDAWIEKRAGDLRYLARYRDTLGRPRSKSFGRRADAQRLLLEVEADKARGLWLDPRGREMPLATWVEEFLLLSHPKAIQVRMGHSSIRLGHLTPA